MYQSLIASLSLAGFVTLWAATATAAPPNVIVVLADDLGWADLGCYGNTFNETPDIDRLAREGMRWTQAYAGPVCSPTRANLQSGRDQARYGITQHIPGHRRPYAALIDPPVPRHLPLEVETFAERLGEAGYRTGYFGKWHLGGRGFGPADQGWQTALELQGHTVPPAIRDGGTAARTAEFLTDRAVAFIAAHGDRPFLLQVSHYAVHIPLSTTPELLKKYRAKQPMAGYPSHPEYAGLLEELDRSVGRIVEAVDKAGLADNTLIVFLSDNGGLEHEQNGRVVTSNNPLRGEKGSLYEGGIRVPAIVRWPGHVPPHTVCDVPITSMDWHPTLTALAGWGDPSAPSAPNVPKPPSEPAPSSGPSPSSGPEPANEPVSASERTDGISLVPLLSDPAADLDRDKLYWHLPHYHHSSPASAIRSGDWKLIEFFEHGDLELYNLAADPGEQTNLADREPALARRLQSDLASWRKRVGARMPVPNPDYDPARAELLAKPRPRRGR